jgi:hypothetical protein
MIVRKPPLSPKPKTLAQQQADFTAEGSPPPGNVAGSTPVTAQKAAGAPALQRATPARKGPLVGRSRWQR